MSETVGMKRSSQVFALLGMLMVAMPVSANENKAIELDTTRIKVNEELPQILYIVPWKDFEPGTSRRFKLRLHDFFGDLYEPQLPTDKPAVQPQQQDQSS